MLETMRQLAAAARTLGALRQRANRRLANRRRRLHSTPFYLMRSAENENVRRAAAETLLDRGFGRPESKSTIDMNLKQEFADALVSVGIRTTDQADEGMAERPGAVH
jgi:hypothetical protein